MSCYYLIASLPRLNQGKKPLLSTDEFKLLCRSQLSARDAAAAVRLCDPPPDGGLCKVSIHPFEARWQAREIQLRNAVARARAARRRTDAAGSLRQHEGFDVWIEEAVENAFDSSNPLEREQVLDRLRWTILDELAGVDPFTPSVVLAYAIRLRLAQRWAALNEEDAMQRVETTLNASPEKEDQNTG